MLSTNRISLKKISTLFVVLVFSTVLLIFFQNCADKEGGDLFRIGSQCADCTAQEDEKLLAIDITPNISLGLPLASNNTISNLSITANCHNGNFSRNIIRWQIRDPVGSLKTFGTASCSSDGTYSIRKSITRPQFSAGNYSLELTIFGVTGNNQEVQGPNSKAVSIISARNAISPPILFTVNSNGTLPANNVNHWTSKLRVEARPNELALNTFVHGLCHYNVAGGNQVEIHFSKAGVLPGVTNNNSFKLVVNCQQLATSIQGYNGYFFYNGADSLTFLRNGVNYEACVDTNSSLCQSGITALQNRMFDVTTIQQDVTNNIQVSDKKVLALTFTTNPVTNLNAYNGKNWNLDIMLELFRRAKLSLDLVNSADLVSPNTVLNVQDYARLALIFQSREDFDEDEDNKTESFSTRKWVLGALGLTERKSSSNQPMKIIEANLFANIIYKQSLNNLSAGILCGLPQTSGQIINVSGADSSGANVEAQRIALCITAKRYLGLFYQSNLMSKALAYGITYNNNQCVTRNDSTSLSLNFCDDLKNTFNQVKSFMNTFLGAGKSFADSSVQDDKKMNATRAIGQFVVNQIMKDISNNDVLDSVTKKVLSEKGLTELQSNSSILTLLRPKEFNFNNPNPQPFAAYTSINNPGSTNATGSYNP